MSYKYLMNSVFKVKNKIDQIPFTFLIASVTTGISIDKLG